MEYAVCAIKSNLFLTRTPRTHYGEMIVSLIDGTGKTGQTHAKE